MKTKLAENLAMATLVPTPGKWGVFVLLVFTGLYAGGYLLGRRGAAFWLAAYWVGLLALSYLSGFSIGLFYVPALLLLLIATRLLVTEKIKVSGSNRAAS